MKILFITHLLPFPPDRGGYIRTYNLIRGLSRNHKVDLISYLFRPEDQNQVKFFEPFCSDIKVIPLNRKAPFFHLPLSLFSHLPYWYSRDFSKKMKELICNQIGENNYEVIFEEQLPMVGYVPKGTKTYRIYANIMIGGMLMERFWKNQRNPLIRMIGKLEAGKLRRLEKEVCEDVDLIITVSEEEKRVLASWGLPCEKIVSIPMGVDTDEFKPVQINYDSKNIINLGLARFPPNADGIIYFCNEIYPEIKKSCPHTHLYIVGAEPPKNVRKLGADSSITVTGFVEDLQSFLANTGVFVVPLRVGGGVKVRTLNALAMGLPVVSTSIGVEGIDVTDGKDVLIADSPADFTKAVIEVFSKPELKKTLCKNGPLLIKKKYTWDIIFKQLETLINAIQRS